MKRTIFSQLVNPSFTASNQIISQFIEIVKDWKLMFNLNRSYSVLGL